MMQTPFPSVSNRVKYVSEKLGLRRSNVGSWFDTSHHLNYFTPPTLRRLLGAGVAGEPGAVVLRDPVEGHRPVEDAGLGVRPDGPAQGALDVAAQLRRGSAIRAHLRHQPPVDLDELAVLRGFHEGLVEGGVDLEEGIEVP